MDDWHLLKTYTDERDENAFAAVVGQHLGLVYGTAMRICGENSAAEDVTQAVFILLEEKADLLEPTGSLASWLYQTTVFKARKYQEKERSRRDCEQKSTTMINGNLTETSLQEEPDWTEIRPLLDSAFESLRDEDRAILLLRFLEDRSLKAIGATLKITEEAARKRISRAVANLQSWFQKRGINCTGDALSRTICGSVMITPPVSLLSRSIESAVTQSGLTTAAASETGAWTIWKSAMVASFMVGVGIPVVSSQRSTDINGENESLVSSSLETGFGSSLVAPLTPIEEEWTLLWETHGPPVGDLKGLLQAIAKIEDPMKQGVFRAVAFREWARRDLPIGDLVSKDRFALFEVLLESDVAKAAKLAGTFGERTYFNGLPSLNSLVKKNPAKIADFIRLVEIPFVDVVDQGSGSWLVGELAASPKADHERSQEIRDVLESLAEKNPAFAEKVVSQLSGWHKQQAMAGMIAGKAQGDLGKALDLIRSLDDSNREKGGALEALMFTWLERSPVEVFDSLKEMTQDPALGQISKNFKAKLISLYAHRDWEGSLQILKEDPEVRVDGYEHEKMGGILSQQLSLNPEKALGIIQRFSGDRRITSLINYSMYRGDPEVQDTIWEWSKRQKPSKFVRETAMRLLSALADEDPKRAVAMLLEAPNLPSQWPYQSLAHTFITQGDGQIDEILKGAPEKLKMMVRSEMARGHYDGLSNETLIELFDQTPPYRKDWAISSLAKRLTESHPEKAIEWALSQPTEKLQRSAASSVVRSWMDFDDYAASEWVDSLPQGDLRESTTKTLIRTLVDQKHFDTAWAWVMNEDDGERRLGYLTNIAKKARETGSVDKIETLTSGAELTESEKIAINEALEQ